MMSILFDLARDRLEGDWTMVDSADAEVVLFDPRRDTDTAAGVGAIRGQPIALLDPEQSVPPAARACLYRPLRIDALVHTLNAVAAGSDEPAAASGAGGSTTSTLAQALRAAVTETSADTVGVLDGVGELPLVLDGRRNRARGAIDRVTPGLLRDDRRYSLRHVAPGAARKIAADEPERPLYRFLWDTALADEGGEPLFGDTERTVVHCPRFPRLSEVSVPRRQMRVFSIARKRRLTLRQLASASGIGLDELVPLCNGAWLTGAMETVEAAADPARGSRASSGRRARRPIAERLRNRLGMG